MIIDEQNFRILPQEAQDEFKNKKIIVSEKKPNDKKSYLIHLDEKDLYCYTEDTKEDNVI